ncbi:MAG TPA: hypothetical protein VGL99_01280 [Chloroflexota bacterium]|jgi:hypothetical protein
MFSPIPAARRLVVLSALLGALLVPSATASAQTFTPIQPLQLAQQLIANGGFEDAASTAWHKAGFATWTTAYHHCGTHSANLPWGNWGLPPNTSGGAIDQEITPPAGTLVDFWLYFSPLATSTQQLDVRAYEPSTGNSTWLAVYANNGNSPGIPYIAPGAWTHISGIDLTPLAGKTISLQFIGRFNPNVNTTNIPPGFYLDDIAAWTPGLRLTPVPVFPTSC